MSLFTNKTPLFLPEGSVRGILALSVVGAFIVNAVDADTAILVLGFYFLTRK